MHHAVLRAPLACLSSFKTPHGARSFSPTLSSDSLTYRFGHLPGHSCEKPAAEDGAPVPSDTLWLSHWQSKCFAQRHLEMRAAGTHVSTPEGRQSRHMPAILVHITQPKAHPLWSAFVSCTPLSQATPPPWGPDPGPSSQRCSQSTGKGARFQLAMLCQGCLPAKVGLAPDNGCDPSLHTHPHCKHTLIFCP